MRSSKRNRWRTVQPAGGPNSDRESEKNDIQKTGQEHIGPYSIKDMSYFNVNKEELTVINQRKSEIRNTGDELPQLLEAVIEDLHQAKNIKNERVTEETIQKRRISFMKSWIPST
ncbi:hypothetical protein EVAR_55187_1 [Eumeta japonica]|uniref:Uncharacterized protein n=1 Tax=Eumeta variegata TaxID=151549 RepID=A0A4C1Y5J6_EUMVA|nr:hypothetical protein EVAR_55187_1 [Eumeta japonica]